MANEDDTQHDDPAAGPEPEPHVAPQEVIEEIASGAPLDLERLRALSGAGDSLVADFVTLWPKVAAERRREVLAKLQQLSDDDATADYHRIHLTALHDDDPATRMLAVRGLWEQEREDYMHLLIALLRNDQEATVRAAAAEALGNFAVNMEFGMLSDEAEDTLGTALREAVEDVTESEEVRARALDAIGASSAEWVAELISEQYDSPSEHMRVAALRAMGRNAADGWLPVLLHNFDDDQSDVRAAAATAAGQLLLEEAVGPLTSLLDDADEEVQVAAIEALGEIAGDGAEHVLADLASRSEPRLREAAAGALAAARMNSADYTLLEHDEDQP